MRVLYTDTDCLERLWMPGNIQGQVEQSSEQPDLGEDVPVHYKGVVLEDF